MEASYDSFEAWAASRPEQVQALIRRFPNGSLFLVNNQVHYVIGWTENDKLILSPVNPVLEFKRAQDEKIYICAKHFRSTSTPVFRLSEHCEH